jgi:hypothetical protein
MSNKAVIGQGLRQQQRSLSERVGGLEQSIARLLFGINERFQAMDQRVAAIEETVNALRALQGSDDVDEYIKNARIDAARTASARETAALEQAVADGYVSKEETIQERSLIVARYLDKEGVAIEPGRAQLVMPGIQEPFRTNLLGKAVGATLDLPGGGKFEVLEVYAVDEEKAKAFEAAKALKAQEDAAATAKATADADEAADTAETPAQETQNPSQEG